MRGQSPLITPGKRKDKSKSRFSFPLPSRERVRVRVKIIREINPPKRLKVTEEDVSPSSVG